MDSSTAYRVSAVHRTHLLVLVDGRDVRAELTGRFRFLAESDEELPAVGDYVHALLMDDGDLAIVQDVVPRETVLKRRAAGGEAEFQVIAANVDVAFIVQACDRDFNIARLERYLVAVRDGGVTPAIVLSKADLMDDASRAQLEADIRASGEEAPVFVVSSESGYGMEPLEAALEPDRTYCLLGSSGVGKTTLLNRLIGEETFSTRETRADQKGRHTTTARYLQQLPGGAWLIDTPGMREFGLMGAESGLAETFSDLDDLLGNCRFRDCSHTVEEGCALLEAVASGDLDESRYERYMKLRRESAHYERTNAERRQKDKEFGKLIKRTMQAKKDRR